MDKLLRTQEPRTGYIYDIGCGFASTVENSPSLGALFREMSGQMIVPAFHGYSHCYSCQLAFHPNVIKGMGIEDGETMERTFSGSNALAPITRFASRYRRQLYIDTYFKQVDEDKYLATGTFILDNLVQASEILGAEVWGLQKAMEARQWTEADLERLAAKEQDYIGKLRDKAPYNIHEVAYVELLQKLKRKENDRDTIRTRFMGFMADDPSKTYKENASVGAQIETERRRINQEVTRLDRDIIALEVQLEIKLGERWTPAHPKYQEAVKFLNEKKYLDAVEHLQRLVILRLFELHKLNISQTGEFIYAPNDRP